MRTNTLLVAVIAFIAGYQYGQMTPEQRSKLSQTLTSKIQSGMKTLTSAIQQEKPKQVVVTAEAIPTDTYVEEE